MIVQLFSPIKSGPNNNLLRNTMKFEDEGRNIDDNVKIDDCYSIKSEYGSIFYGQMGLYLTGYITVSFYVKSSNYSQDFSLSFSSGHGDISQYYTITKPGTLDNFVKVTKTINTREWPYSLDIFTIEINNNYDTWICQPKIEYGTAATIWVPSIYDNINYDYGVASFQKAKIGDPTYVESINYYSYKNSVGTFTLKIPKSANYADKLEPKCYICINHKIWLIVEDVLDTDNLYYTVTGKDFKGLLLKRETRGPVDENGKMAYDTISGSTETCAKHYVMNNLVNPLNPKRAIALLTIAENKGRGKAEDSYTSRLEPLDTVEKKICENGNIYYDVTVDTKNNKIIFDVYEGIDRSIEQRVRPQIIFEIGRNNIASIKRQKGESTYKNVFFCSRQAGDATENPYVLDKYTGDEEPAGIDRNEKTLFVSCNSDAEIDQYSVFPMLDYPKIDYIEVDTQDIEDYGVKYFMGDKVTVKYGDVYANATIDSAVLSESNGSKTLKLGFGKMKPKLIQSFNKKISNKGV